MTPDTKQALKELQKQVDNIRKSEDIVFVQSAIRALRVVTGTKGTDESLTTYLKAVDEDGTSSYSVAKAYDLTATITINNTDYKIGLYEI